MTEKIRRKLQHQQEEDQRRMVLPAVARAPEVGNYGAARGQGQGGCASQPNIGLQPTPGSVRSYLAPTARRA